MSDGSGWKSKCKERSGFAPHARDYAGTVSEKSETEKGGSRRPLSYLEESENCLAAAASTSVATVTHKGTRGKSKFLDHSGSPLSCLSLRLDE